MISSHFIADSICKMLGCSRDNTRLDRVKFWKTTFLNTNTDYWLSIVDD